jgi:MFS family permease
MPAPTTLTPRALIILCLASLGWAFSFGLGAPLASIWLKEAGYSYKVVGTNTGTYYLGIALAAMVVPWLMRRWGSGCMVAGCLVSGVTVAIFPYCGSLAAYYGARLINGIAGAMTLIPVESYVNRNSPSQHRSRNFGFYALSIAVGWALGTEVGDTLYKGNPRLAFIVGGVASLLAGFLIWSRLPRFFAAEEVYDGHAPLHVRRNLLSFGTAWSQGVLEGGMIGFLALYLRDEIGMSLERVGWITGGIMIGVILFQVPVAWCADHLGRVRVLLGCYAVTIAGLCLLPFCGDSIWLVTWLFLVGACSGAFYPLGLALLGERLPDSGLARANAWFLAINCLGSWMGPDVMGAVLDRYGTGALFFTGLAAVLLVLAVWAAVCLHDTLRRRRAFAVTSVDPVVVERQAA